jgi:thiamine-phosphate pyrophosphorylase
MLVTEDRLLVGRDLVAVARAAVAGGVTAIQLRLKAATPRELVRQARLLTEAVSVPILINDRPDVAAATGCGVHLGPDDLTPAMARRILPAPAIIGASVGTPAEAARGAEADFWGVGPWRTTATKADAGAAIGSEGFRRIVALAQGRPCIAIGGIRPDVVPLVRQAGGGGVAVISGILAEEDIEAAARRYVSAAG